MQRSSRCVAFADADSPNIIETNTNGTRLTLFTLAWFLSFLPLPRPACSGTHKTHNRRRINPNGGVPCLPCVDISKLRNRSSTCRNVRNQNYENASRAANKHTSPFFVVPRCSSRTDRTPFPQLNSAELNARAGGLGEARTARRPV